jgi:hypothetical protein
MGILRMLGLDGRCEFVSTCECYDEESNTCNKNSGVYYGDGGMCGAYRRLKGWI